MKQIAGMQSPIADGQLLNYYGDSPVADEARELYPPIEPYMTGMLDVGDGQQIYYEQCGNPQGKPVVFIHGGPGGGGGSERRRFFNPQKYRIICYDQRNCGSSTPHASQYDIDLSKNTTWDLVADLERLRAHLQIEKWQIFGGSWGSALGLAYAQSYPQRVTELVLRGIFTLRRTELDWYYNEGASHVYPEFWDYYCKPLLDAGYDLESDKIQAYHELLFNTDPKVHIPAAQAWSIWESATSHLFFDECWIEEYLTDPAAAVAFARIENHYFVNAGWFEPDQLLNGAEKLTDIPTVIVQGRYDMCCPADTAVRLAQRMPNAEVHVVLAGHSSFEPAIADKLVRATDKFADR